MKLFTLLFASLVCTTSLFAQIRPPEIVWQKTYGGLRDDVPRSMIKTPDGGFILGGSTNSRNGDVSGHHDESTPEPPPPGFPVHPDAWLIKIDGTGNKVWQKCVGGYLPDDLYSLIPASDGGYIAFGETSSNNSGSDFTSLGAIDIFVFKFNENGNIIWKKTFGGTGYERGGNIRATADGGYIVASSTNTPTMPGFHWNQSNPNYADIWIFKIDKDGNMLWQKCIGNFFDQSAIDIMQMQNGGYALTAGYSNSNSQTPQAIRFTLDANGNTVDSTFYPDQGPNLTYGMGSLFKIGTTDTIAHSLKYLKKNIAACFNKSINGIKFGNTLLESLTCIPKSDFYSLKSPNQIQSYGSNLNIAVGYTTDTASVLQNHGASDAFFAIFDTHGTVYTRKLFGGSQVDEFIAVVQINNDEFMALGKSSVNDHQVSGNHGSYDFWTVKLRIPPASNTVKGYVFNDKNSNGIKDINENYYENALVKSIKSNNISFSSINSNGAYKNTIDTGAYTTSVLINQQYHTVVPVSIQSNFSTYNNTDSFDFAVQAIPNKKDLEISLIPLSAVRPGFESSYKIVYKNVGTEPLTATALLVKDNRQTFISALPVQGGISNDSITWNLGTLQPFDAGSIIIKLKQAIPPSLQNGDTLILNAEVSPVVGDETALNNKTLLRQRVTGSYDPNDKSEKNGGFIIPQQVSDKEDLEYTIRFQNTGTDTAFNVRVLDTLDGKLDISSISLVTVSHPFTISISDDKYLTWSFNNILLPDSNVNESLSHGYITYRIKAKASVVTGDIIRNSASIYFDFNTPVRTNIQETIVKPAPIAPPPQPFVSGILNSYCSNQGIQKGKIENLPTSASGIIVTVKLDATTLSVAPDSTFSFDVALLSAGTHSIKVEYSNGGGLKTTNQNFENTTAIMPDVNVSASITNIINLTDPVIVTAINTTGGGAGPLYTFGKNRNFTTVWQAESVSSTLTITPSLLTLGDNWVYVRMKSNAGCVTSNTATDSIKLVRDMMTGITDPDNPGKVISSYPNPFNKQLYISGLSAGKSYMISITNLNGQLIQQKRISNRTNTELLLQTNKAGTYLLTIYDEKKRLSLGTIKIIKQ